MLAFHVSNQLEGLLLQIIVGWLDNAQGRGPAEALLEVLHNMNNTHDLQSQLKQLEKFQEGVLKSASSFLEQ